MLSASRERLDHVKEEQTNNNGDENRLVEERNNLVHATSFLDVKAAKGENEREQNRPSDHDDEERVPQCRVAGSSLGTGRLDAFRFARGDELGRVVTYRLDPAHDQPS